MFSGSMPPAQPPAPAPRQKITCRFRSDPISLSRPAQSASRTGLLIPRFQRRAQACRCNPATNGERVAVRVSDEGVRCLVCGELIASTQDRPPEQERSMAFAVLMRATQPEVVVSLPVAEVPSSAEDQKPNTAALWDRYNELSAEGGTEDLAVQRRSLLHRFIAGIVNDFPTMA